MPPVTNSWILLQPAHEFSSAPHCSTCLWISKSKARSGRILVFQSFGSFYVFHILLCEKEQRLSLENLRRWMETVPKSAPQILFLLDLPHTRKQNWGRLSSSLLPTESRQPVLAISISNKMVWRYLGVLCVVSLKNFLNPWVKSTSTLLKLIVNMT